jgi:hypothetical protein
MQSKAEPGRGAGHEVGRSDHRPTVGSRAPTDLTGSTVVVLEPAEYRALHERLAVGKLVIFVRSDVLTEAGITVRDAKRSASDYLCDDPDLGVELVGARTHYFIQCAEEDLQADEEAAR